MQDSALILWSLLEEVFHQLANAIWVKGLRSRNITVLKHCGWPVLEYLSHDPKIDFYAVSVVLGHQNWLNCSECLENSIQMMVILHYSPNKVLESAVCQQKACDKLLFNRNVPDTWSHDKQLGSLTSRKHSSFVCSLEAPGSSLLLPSHLKSTIITSSKSPYRTETDTTSSKMPVLR